MAHITRHDEIMRLISRLRTVSVQELTERLQVSEVTIRKDLTFLEELGSVVRTRGGAQLAEDRARNRDVRIRRTEHHAEKERIARRARELVNDGDTIFVDSGSTCMLLAAEIAEMNLRVVTDSLDVMSTLADAPGVSLISLGGNYRREAGSFIGPIAVETLKGLRIETCFLGVSGINRNGVFSSENSIEAEVKRQVLAICRRRVVLADASKFEKEAFAVFARAASIDILIVDRWVAAMEPLKEMGTEIVVAA